jgi:hypothetical protein
MFLADTLLPCVEILSHYIVAEQQRDLKDGWPTADGSLRDIDALY